MVAVAFNVYLCTGEGPQGPRVDLNIRGGSPEFVCGLSPTKIAIPDYPGKGTFFALGNLTQNPKAGVLFPFTSGGRMLQVVGDVEIKWDPGNCYEAMDREVIISNLQVLETRRVGEILEWKPKEMSSFCIPVGADFHCQAL